MADKMLYQSLWKFNGRRKTYFLGKPDKVRKAKLPLLCVALHRCYQYSGTRHFSVGRRSRWKEAFISIISSFLLVSFCSGWKVENKIPPFVSDPKSVRENTHAQRKKGQVQYFTTSPGWHKRDILTLAVSILLVKAGLLCFCFFFFSHTVNSPGWGILNGSCCCAA